MNNNFESLFFLNEKNLEMLSFHTEVLFRDPLLEVMEAEI